MSTEGGQVVKFLTIRLADERLALDAGIVREILDLVPVTEVPNAPAFATGLVNVRGRVVPLADIRVLFGIERRPADDDTRIVVVEVPIDGEPTIVGLLADKVSDVSEFDTSLIEPAPPIGMRWDREFVRGVIRHDDEFVFIPDTIRIFELAGSEQSQPVATEERSPL